MSTKTQTPPKESGPPAQKTQSLNRPDLPLLERFWSRIGFYDEAFLILYMVALVLSPYLFDYLICRPMMQCGNDACRSYRITASKCIDVTLVVYFVRLAYLGWGRKRQLNGGQNVQVTSK